MAGPDTPKGDTLEVMVTLIEAYEAKHFPVDIPDPLKAIKFDMERNDLANFKCRLKALEAKVAEEGIILTEAQVQALERKELDDEACGEIDHTKTRVKSPQTNGICERFHKTVLQEFYQVTFRKKIYESIEDLQTDLTENAGIKPVTVRSSPNYYR